MDRREFCAGAAAAAALAFAAGEAAAADPILLRDLYNKDLSFSARALALEGTRVSVAGFMAPPLKADAAFFVLTRRPMATCPFCESAADWPPDILAIYLKRTLDVVPYNIPIVSRGVLELGDFRDPDTGFLSRVRLSDSAYERA